MERLWVHSWYDYEIFKDKFTIDGEVDYLAMLRYVQHNHSHIAFGQQFGNALIIDCLTHIMEKISPDGK